MNGRQFFKALRVVQKLDLREILKSIDFSNMGNKDNATKLGVDVLGAIVPELYKVEHELYVFIADIKDVEVSEIEHMDFNEILNILKEVIKEIDLGSFLKQAVKLKPISK